MRNMYVSKTASHLFCHASSHEPSIGSKQWSKIEWTDWSYRISNVGTDEIEICEVRCGGVLDGVWEGCRVCRTDMPVRRPHTCLALDVATRACITSCCVAQSSCMCRTILKTGEWVEGRRFKLRQQIHDRTAYSVAFSACDIDIYVYKLAPFVLRCMHV